MPGLASIGPRFGGDFFVDARWTLTHSAISTKASGVTRRYPDIDKRIGTRLRSLRLDRGLSLDAMAATVGVAYQQIQKYESGENRIAAATLHVVATAFETPIAWFFESETVEKKL
ncbi:helix-turn-helix transcriptional regulator [uncultured Hyphomicrobium sp.]|jgi:DNA-binding XRE family transcriptional regulator|uniref:helix-turn-helix domain-containing protein n=1 Tax=uncultured Hyphomicrobium sp. TaxID=194373 RepID=UPI0025F0A6E1|nr:helix-turn-helix transcriptional regulator [uncultured Hyphomicrobium sp.]